MLLLKCYCYPSFQLSYARDQMFQKLATLISGNEDYEIFEIWNGMNTKKIILGLFLWDIKRLLPEFLGGFKRNI